jgi:hypothetical protein
LAATRRSAQAEKTQDEQDNYDKPYYPDNLVHFVQASLNSGHWSLIGSTLAL